MEITELAFFNAMVMGVILAGLVLATASDRKRDGLPLAVFILLMVSLFGLLATFFN